MDRTALRHPAQHYSHRYAPLKAKKTLNEPRAQPRMSRGRPSASRSGSSRSRSSWRILAVVTVLRLPPSLTALAAASCCSGTRVDEATRKLRACAVRGMMISWMWLGMAGSFSMISRPSQTTPIVTWKPGGIPERSWLWMKSLWSLRHPKVFLIHSMVFLSMIPTLLRL